MLLRDSADILKPTQTQDSIGRVITSFAVDRTIFCDFQPLKYSTQYKPYGITDKTSNMMFCKDFQLVSDVQKSKKAIRIQFDGQQYIIDAILPYRNHVEVYLEKVI